MSKRYKFRTLLHIFLTVAFILVLAIYASLHIQGVLPVFMSLIMYPTINTYLLMNWSFSTPRHYYWPSKSDRMVAILHIYLLFVINICVTLGLLINFSVSDYSAFLFASLCLSIPVCIYIQHRTKTYRGHYKLEGNPLSLLLFTGMLCFNTLFMINMLPQDARGKSKNYEIVETRLAYGFIPSIGVAYISSNRKKNIVLNISRGRYNKIISNSNRHIPIYRGLFNIPWHRLDCPCGANRHGASYHSEWHSPSSFEADWAYDQ